MNHELVETAAYAYATLTLFTIGFHCGLAMGAPWGRFTLGGKYVGALPPAARTIPVVSIIVLGICACIVLIRAHMMMPEHFVVSETAIWIPALLMSIGLFMNAFSKSRPERRLWVPVILVMLVSAIIVARS